MRRVPKTKRYTVTKVVTETNELWACNKKEAIKLVKQVSLGSIENSKTKIVVF